MDGLRTIRSRAAYFSCEFGATWTVLFWFPVLVDTVLNKGFRILNQNFIPGSVERALRQHLDICARNSIPQFHFLTVFKFPRFPGKQQCNLVLITGRTENVL